MANYFVDSTTGDNGDDGTTMDLAWATLEYALESGALSAGDIVWVRRIHDEWNAGAPSSDVVMAYSGTATSPIRIIGWPRAADSTADGATWTNGSTTVDLVTTLSMDWEKHVGRYVSAPDGETYMISRITDSNTFIIDREYAGATVTLTDGAFTIQADEEWYDDMGTAYSFDDSAWTIKETTWDADADDLPLFDFQSASYQFQFSAKHNIEMANLFLTQSADGSGSILCSSATNILLKGIYWYQAAVNQECLTVLNSTTTFKRSVLRGAEGVSTGQNGITCSTSYLKLTDVIIQGAGNSGIVTQQCVIDIENVNIGVEAANYDEDIDSTIFNVITGRDVKLGAGVGELDRGSLDGVLRIAIENYNKTLGAHKVFNMQGAVTKTDVVAGSGDPYKRTGGADSVLSVEYDIANKAKDEDAADPILVHEFEATTDTRTYRYYVQAEGAVTAAQLWMEVEYVAEHDDTSEYVIKKVTSTDAIDARSGASDWSQYIEVGDITPALASTVRVKIYCSYYHATNNIYIDPLPEVTT
jgi:hypothetical protein